MSATKELRRLNSTLANLRGDLMVAELDFEENPTAHNRAVVAALEDRIDRAKTAVCEYKTVMKITHGEEKARRLMFRASA